MTEDVAFEYDVAFSFVAEDEPLASRLNDLIRDRLATFLYSKAQEKLVGTDGEVTFGEVFGEKARVVVVLYREKWGTTPWTRIEETAIKNRGFSETYDFTLFIPLSEKPTVPRWLPVTHIWYDLYRFGEAAAAGIIEQKVRQRGGVTRRETLDEQSARLLRERTFHKAREQYLNSEKAVRDALDSIHNLFSEIETRLQSENFRKLFSFQRTAAYAAQIMGHPRCLQIYWQNEYVNSLEGSFLRVAVWNGRPLPYGVPKHDGLHEVSSKAFTFDMLPSEQKIWREKSSTDRSFPTNVLAEELLRYLIAEERDARRQ